MQQSSPAKLFQSAVTCYQQHQLEHAAQLCAQLLRLVPGSSDAMHLMGLCTSSTAPKQAEQYFKQAISTAPTNSIYIKSYANFLLSNHEYTNALALYEKSYALQPTDTDSAYGIAFIYYQQKRYRSTLSIINQIDIPRSSIAKWNILTARALLECGDAVEAIQKLKIAMKFEPNHAGLMLTNVLALRQLQKPEQALEYLHVMHNNAETNHLKGCLYYDMQQYDEAEKYLRQALEQKADYIEAHVALNKLYWENGNKEKFIRSFIQALSILPKSISIYLSYISHLLMMGSINEAVAVTEKAIQLCGPHPHLLHQLGTALFKRGESQAPLQLYCKAAEQSPTNIRFLIDAANMLIRNENYKKALELLNQANQFDPNNQEIWAYLGLCWRLTADPRHEWLNNYSSLVSVTKLPTPPGYDNFNDFWQELTQAIKALHTTVNQPLDQSVQNGTQTVGYLFNDTTPVIQVYKNLLENHVQQYLSNLPLDTTHPLLRRNQPAFRFSGSWSVKLQNDGFHTNHVHPQGWLSVCTYLQVPDSVSPDDPKHQGWLKLGETSLHLGDKEQIARAICPEEGLCIIFPSYIWHGTVPFHGDSTRITLPCDVIPDL